MDSAKNSIEIQRDSKGIDGNGDGHLHIRKYVDGEMGMATSTLEENVDDHLHFKQNADGHTHLRRGMATHTLRNLLMKRWEWPPPP